MFDNIIAFVSEKVVLFDIIFLIFIIYFSIQCFSKGFFISLNFFFEMGFGVSYYNNFSS